MKLGAGFERVCVELEWYDGPRAGIADIHGVPHRFKSNFDDNDEDWLGTFLVFPIDAVSLALEREQWRLFVDWNRRYESGEEGVTRHPGHGGIDPRWDEIEALLAGNRDAIPAGAKRARAESRRLNREERYAEDGPAYRLRWTFL
jgi:hypothetical protein